MSKSNHRGGRRSRGNGRGGRGRGGHKGGQNRGDGQGVRATYSSFDQHNPRLEAYYLDQQVLDPSEWADFMTSLRTPLPTTFRLTAGKHTTPQLTKALKEIYVPYLENVTFDGEKVEPPKNLPWYPEGLGWHLATKKNVIRKSPEFKRFHQFLVHETDVGSISRQEAVSMLPPLFLNVQPHHLVLDMCAAPGSKTAQLVEALHSPFTSHPDAYNPMPTGLVVANDSDTKRAHMLVHQSQRLPSPNLIVTNLDASKFPAVRVPWKASEPDASVQQVGIKFDRILADVPCSGDGTIRKNLPIWKEWTPNNAVGLHALQLKIVMRGLSLLRDGGRLVYSTCSMNPIENEAVVAEAIRLCKGKVRIVDCSDKLPELVRRKGLTTWKAAPGKGSHLFGKSNSSKQKEKEKLQDSLAAAKPADNQEPLTETPTNAESEAAAAKETEVGDENGTGTDAPPVSKPEPGSPEYRDSLPQIAWIDNWDQLNELDADLAFRTPKSLWPQGDEEQIGTQHCMRLYPHLQDTGAFFVTVLEKLGDVDAEGMAAGMIRAMQHFDAHTPDGQSVSQAIKRELSPEPESDLLEPAAKRVKEEEEEKKVEADESHVNADVAAPVAQANSDEAEDVKMDPEQLETSDAVTNVKEDKHASDRAAKNAQRHSNNDGHGMPGGLPYKEDPFAYVPHTNDQIQTCIKFFNLKSTFPCRNLLVRNEEHLPLRSVYLSSTTARAVITGGGSGRGPHPYMNPLHLRLINCGVKALGRQDAGKDTALECKWRIISDGLLAIRPHINQESVIQITLADLSFLITHHYPILDLVPGEFGKVMSGKKMGSHIVDVLPSEHNGHKLEYTLSFPIWRAVNSINLMLDKQEKSALSFRLFDTDLSSPDGGRQFSSQPAKKKKEAVAVDAETLLADAEDAARANMSLSNPTPTAVSLQPYQSEYIQLALDSDILRFDGPFTLKSGRQSPYFFNAGLFNTGAKVAKVAECYAKRIVESGVKFDVLFGPAYKGIPLAAATALALHTNHGIDIGFCFNRKEAKTHGEGGTLVGAPLKGKVLILDDVITAGTAINEAMNIILSQEGAELAGVVIALDRQEKSAKDGVDGETSAIMEVEKRYNTKVHSVVTLDQIIEYMKQKSDVYATQMESIKDYRRRYGVSELASTD